MCAQTQNGPNSRFRAAKAPEKVPYPMPLIAINGSFPLKNPAPL
jgi:hypothetical protein